MTIGHSPISPCPHPNPTPNGLGNPPPSGPREGGEGEESAEAMTGGLWGAEHSRVLKTLASASSDSQGAVLPFLPSTVKRPPTQPLSGAAEGEEEEEEKDEEGEWAAVLPTVPIDREKSVLAATLPQQQRAGSAPSMAGKGERACIWVWMGTVGPFCEEEKQDVRNTLTSFLLPRPLPLCAHTSLHTHIHTQTRDSPICRLRAGGRDGPGARSPVGAAGAGCGAAAGA